MYGAQATGCNPITTAVKTGASKAQADPQARTPSPRRWPSATRPTATSPRKLIRETGGWGEDVDDDEIVEAMRLLAETEGIFAETAGGVTLAVARKLIEQGRIARDEEIVLCITGNGLKTQDALVDRLDARPVVIEPTLEAFESVVDGEAAVSTSTTHASETAELVGSRP